MNHESIPPPITLPLASLVTLGVDHWRLANWLASLPSAASAGPARHALRRMADVLAGSELQVLPLDGQPYDPGMAAEVVHSDDDPTLPDGITLIAETVSPLVLWRGQVVRQAEVVTRRGVGGK